MVGRTLSHYQIVSLLGVGGMGEVYRARDTRLDRTVALKILPSEVAADQQRMRRFVGEAKAASALNHPSVAHIYEIGEAEGVSFIAMEYVEGQTLSAKIGDRPLEVAEVIEIGIQAADALDEAHGKEITHRDLKPANIMVTPRGQVKVLDFGLAKINRPGEQDVDTNLSTLMQTTPGVVMGTVPYMSPEQALGRDVDHRSDLFSLGAVLYELATARRPFSGMNASETVDLILHAQPDAISRFNHDVPEELERIVGKCLEKERERRYQSARELLDDLQNLKRGGDSTARTAQRVVPGRGSRRRRSVVVALAVAFLVLGSIGLYLLRGRSPAIDSVAILPFVNANADPNTEYLADGIPESIINSLSQLPHLKVMSRNSVFRFKGQETDAQEVGHKLGVGAVLTGRITQRGDSLAISIELVDVRDNSQIWGQQYNRRLADVFAVQGEMAKEISEKLRLKLTGAERQQLTKRPTENLKAFQYYMQGRSYSQRRTREDLLEAVRYCEKAIEEDRSYALAYAGLADAYINLGGRAYITPREGRQKAEEAARQAIALDTNLAEAHIALGQPYIHFPPYNPSLVDSELRRAIELSPSLAMAHNYLGVSLMQQGLLDQGLEEVLRARELDPLSPIIARIIVIPSYIKRDHARALELLRQANELSPAFITTWEIEVYIQNGLFKEALAELEKAGRDRKSDPILLYSTGMVYAAQKKQMEALQIIKELEEMSGASLSQANYIARIYAALNEKELTLTWLEHGLAAGSIGSFLKDEPVWDTIRGDPRFADLLLRMGLTA